MDSIIGRNTRWSHVEKIRALYNLSKSVRTQEKNGKFSARSSYILIKEMFSDGSGECSNASRQHVFWKALWKMNVPNKVKVFAWRAFKKGLPTQHN